MRHLLRDERGTALTEFILFLPVFIVCFIGLGNLITAGIGATKVEMIGQQKTWEEALQVSTSSPATHMSPLLGAEDAFGELGALAGDDANPQQTADGVERFAYNAGLGFAGHWGESFERAIIPKAISYADNIDDLTANPHDIIGHGSYPNLLLNDSASSVLDRPEGGGALSVTDVISGLISISGFIPAQAAGIRYGVAFGEHEDDFQLMAGGPTKHYESHHDILVPPNPLSGNEHRIYTFGAAYAAMLLQEEYRVMLKYGKSEWDGGFDTGRGDQAQQEADDRYEEEREEACAEAIANIPDADDDGEPDHDPPEECQ